MSLAVLFGRDAEKLSQSINGSVKTVQVDTLEQAVDVAREHAASDDIVLLSPACASFDQFKAVLNTDDSSAEEKFSTDILLAGDFVALINYYHYNSQHFEL